jgi:REP element-mobilizing transposase RayT
MTFNPEIHHRRSIRLKDYDYSQAGAYFMTVCAWKKENMFGEISEGKVSYSDAGEIISDVWHKLPDRFASIELDEFVIMPNHVHGILILNVPVGVGLALPGTTGVPKHIKGAASGAPTLGDIIRTFKSESSITVNRLLDRQGSPVWQRNYYEHVIRDEPELYKIREYIRQNPLRWAQDEENPASLR